MRCVALLRGINVSGRKTMNMADLRRAVEELGFENVQTYAQSGNLVFDCPNAEHHTIARRIEEKTSAVFGYSTRVLVRTQSELEEVIKNNPLVDSAYDTPDKLFVTFLADTPDEATRSKLHVTPGQGERFAVVGKEVYLYCPRGYARTKLSNATFEAKLNTTATTRNWRTINKLLTLLK